MKCYENQLSKEERSSYKNFLIHKPKKFAGVLVFLVFVSFSSSAQSTLCPLSFKPGGGSYVNSMTINGQTVPGYTPEGNVYSYPTYIDSSNANAGRLVKGMTYSLSINVNSGAFNSCFVKLWIDFNGNNIVDAVNEIVFLANSQFQGGHVFTGNITIPSNVTIGEKYLRVITTMVSPTEECGHWDLYLWGQAIDYTVTIAEPSIIPSSLSVCQGAPAILTFSTAPGTAPYTFTYTINDGVNQTVSTFADNTSVDLYANTYGVGTLTYKLISIKDAADNDLPLNGTTSIVTVKPRPPAPTITGSSIICPGTTVQLASSSASNNHWSTGATSQTISVMQPGNYYVEVTNPEGCTSASEIYTLGEITYFESPVVAGGNYKNLCLGSSTNINVTGASGYTWSPAIGLSATTGASVIANPTTTTVYTITSASAGNCSTSATVNVINPPLTITANGPVIFCEGDSVLLSAKPDAGHSFALNGVSNAVTTPNLVQAFPTSSVTLELWFKADRQGVIVTELGPSQIGNIGINTGWHDSQIEILADGKVKVRVWNLPAIELGFAPFSTWQHVVLRYNAATQTLDGFLNNIKSASSVQGIRSVPSGQFWSFGATDNQNLGSGEFFSGQMDEIRIWNVARTDAQILGNYKIPVPENSQGLVVYYKFDEVSEFNAIDASINGNYGAIWNYSFTDATPARPASTVPLDYSSYLWSTGATTPDIRVFTTGNYSVTTQGSEGCVSTVSQQVTVKTKLVPVDSVVTICFGDSVSLSVAGTGGYNWFPSTGLSATIGSSVKASPAESTTYTITSDDPGVCSTTIRVNVNPLPGPLSITASGPTTFCSGGSVTLTASGATNYLWSTGATTESIDVTQGGIYTVTSTNENGCSASASKEVIVGAIPQVVGSNTITVCAGVSATLTVSGGDNYSWSPDVYLNQTTGSSVVVTPYQTTNYNVIFSGGMYCPATFTVNVKQRPTTPTIYLNGPMAFCSGGSTKLSVDEYSSYLWSNGETTREITVTESGNYNVTVTNENGCSSTSLDPVNINVLPVPETTITGNNRICEGSSTTLTFSGADTYFLSGVGEIGSSYTVSPVETTTYTVYGYNGCYKEASITVYVDPATTYYLDSDGDGYGDAAVTMQACTIPLGWVSNSLDCDDRRPNVDPGATEICNGIDDDCDGMIDEDVSTIFYQDADGDGFGNASVSVMACSTPAGYVTNDGDCNDSDAAIYPGAVELCDGKDNNCNGQVDENSLVNFYRDADGDGYGDPATLIQSCSIPDGYVTNNTDCNDNDASIHQQMTYYLDADGDGYGNLAVTTQACSAPEGYVLDNTDCDDSKASVHPGAIEICDGLDNNCNGQADEGLTIPIYYPDTDGDGFGDSKASGVSSCNNIPGYITNNFDCDDKDPSIHQSVLYYADNDNDGHGGQIGVWLCSASAPWGFSTTNDDCDDTNPTIPAMLYIDADGDGYGIGNVIVYCSKDKPTGYSTNNEDCNDEDASVHQQTMYYVDADGDGIGGTNGQLFCLSSPPAGYSRFNSDCDDNNALEQCCVFTNPMSFSQWPIYGNCYQLTDMQDQVRAIWGNEAISLDHDFSLEFNTTQAFGSQGMMFILQHAGVSAIGTTSAAGSLGYYNSPDFLQSIGVELDNANSGATYNDLSAAHISIVKNGNSAPVAGTYDLGSSFSDITKALKIAWNHTTKILSVYLDGVLVLSYNSDLVNDVFGGNASVYFGFTSANEPLADPKAKPSSQAFCVNKLIYDNALKISQSSEVICNNGQLMTNATENCTFLWSTGATTPTIEITESGLYSVTVTNAEGCVTSVSYNAIVNQGPIITANGSTVLCLEATVTLSASPADSYLWSNGATTQSIVVNEAGEYNVSSGVCAATQPIVVSLANAIITASGPLSFCPGESVVLTASEGTGYLWSTGAATSEITVGESGTYSVSITYEGGCTLEASVDVVAGALTKPHAYAANDGHPVDCNNPMVYLNQDTYPNYDQYTFIWYRNSTDEQVTPEQPTAEFLTNQPGNYYLVVRKNNCVSDISDAVSVVLDAGDPSVLGDNAWRVHVWQTDQPGPPDQENSVYKGYYTETSLSFDTRPRWPQFLSPSFAPGYIGCPVFQDHFKWVAKRKGFLPGNYNIRIPFYDEEAKLRINGNLVWSDLCCSNSGSTIVWSGYLNGNSTIEFEVKETMALAFGAIQFELTECSLPQPIITVEASTEICEGSEITLTAEAGFESYVWMNGENVIESATTNTLLVTAAGSYTVRVGNGNNCESANSEAVVVTVNPANTYYQDSDGDGYGNPAVTTQACAAPAGYVANNTDCDDTKSAVHPGAAEICDGLDNDCNGQIDEGITQTFYRDADSDGYGNLAVTIQACAAPAGYVTDHTDCDDSKAAVHPGATEVCDGLDNDCNGQIDEGGTQTFYQDADGDGYGNPAVTIQACSAPTGYVSNSTDCDDSKAAVHPGATETCDGLDNDCNGQIDEGVKSTFYRDADGDGYGNPAVTTQACAAPTGYVSNSTDCDDSKAAVHPGATEICDGLDNDCNGQIDEGVKSTFYRDADGDGYGNPAVSTQACSAPTGYVANNTDCDDSKAAVHPGAVEICDGLDNDCNGQIDEGGTQTFYRDADGDGYGNPAVTTQACAAPAGYVANNTDCDDSKAAVHPGATEICDGLDNDCNGQIDDGVKQTFYRDTDGDGYGNPAVTTQACAAPAGYVANNTDCDDSKAAVHPGAAEICDGLDNNCNGSTDEGFPLVTYYRDADGDGYGNSAITITAKCAAPAGYVTNNTDCNDADVLVHAPILYYVDADKDGYGSATGKTTTACSSIPPAGYSRNNTDCNDKNAAINPGATEICDGIDNNCNGVIDEGCALPTMSINDVSMAEGNTGKKTMSFDVVLSQTSTKTITVNYATSNSTATAGADYTAKTGTLTFKPNTLKQTIDIAITTDKIAESNETFNVVLSSVTNAQLNKATGIGSILNDDGNVPNANSMVQITKIPANETEIKKSVKVGPNPAISMTTLYLYGYTGKVSVQLFTAEGKLLQLHKLQAASTGYEQLKLNISQYAAGIYLIAITDDKGIVHTEKLVVAK